MQPNNEESPHGNGLCRYDELRFKTNAELLLLIHNELDLGLYAARQALKCAGDFTSAEVHYQMARKARLEAARLLFFLAEDSRDERSRLEPKLESLREILNSFLAIRSMAAPTKDAIVSLARALWEARDCPEGSAEEDWFQAERALRSQTVCAGS